MTDVYETGTFIIYRGQQLGPQSLTTAKEALCGQRPLIPAFRMKRQVDL